MPGKDEFSPAARKIIEDGASIQIPRSRRYPAKGRVELFDGAARLGIGNLRDISTTGVAFTTDVTIPLGKKVRAWVEHLGRMDMKVVRCSDGRIYGAEFVYGPGQERRIADQIIKIFGNQDPGSVSQN